MFIMDASGSVGQTFEKEKELAKNILRRFRIGPKNAKVSLNLHVLDNCKMGRLIEGPSISHCRNALNANESQSMIDVT